MSSRVEAIVPEENIGLNFSKLNSLNNKLSRRAFVRDYSGIPPMSAFFMSMPVPAWIKLVDTTGKKPRFRVTHTNFCFMDAYGIRPDEAPWEGEDKKHWSKEDIDFGDQSDLQCLLTGEVVKSTGEVFNHHAAQREKITTVKWRVKYGSLTAICGAVVDPSYVDKLIVRIFSNSQHGTADYSQLSMGELIDKMETMSSLIGEVNRRLLNHTELVRKYFLDSPIPMWLKQVSGNKSSRTFDGNSFHLTETSKGYLDFERYNKRKKLVALNDKTSDIAAAKSLSVVENGRVLYPHGEATTKSPIRLLNWPIASGDDVALIGGVLVGYK